MYQCELACISGMVHTKRARKQINSHLHQHQWSRKRSNDHRKLLKNAINISVIYDPAIAKVAMQLRVEEKPTYGDTFIHLGLFHITYAFFSMLGKCIVESGG